MRCRCGHNRNAHQHYRPGTDCSGCDCPAFRWHLLADLRDRGEVAGVPEVEDIPQAKSLDEFPAKRPCRVNAEPHWCADTSSDGEAIAAMEKQFADVKIPRRFR